MTISFKVYSATSIDDPAYAYIGKATLSGHNNSTESFYPHHVTPGIDTFLFASLTSSKNVKIYPSKHERTSIELDTRFYKVFNVFNNEPYIYKETVIDNSAEVVTFVFRTIKTDGSLFIKDSKSYLYNGTTHVVDTHTDVSKYTDGEIRIVTPDYQVKSTELPDEVSYKSASLVVPKLVDQANKRISLILKKLVGSQCITVYESHSSIKIDFDDVACPCGIPV